MECSLLRVNHSLSGKQHLEGKNKSLIHPDGDTVAQTLLQGTLVPGQRGFLPSQPLLRNFAISWADKWGRGGAGTEWSGQGGDLDGWGWCLDGSVGNAE